MLDNTKEISAHYIKKKLLDKDTLDMYNISKTSITQILKQLLSVSYRALEEFGENSRACK